MRLALAEELLTATSDPTRSQQDRERLRQQAEQIYREMGVRFHNLRWEDRRDDPSAERDDWVQSAATDVTTAINAGWSSQTDAINAVAELFHQKFIDGETSDNQRYEAAKPFFIAAIRDVGRAGQDIMDMVRAMVRGLVQAGLSLQAQDAMQPYLIRFIEEMRAGFDPFAEPSTPEVAPTPEQAPAADVTEVSDGPDSQAVEVMAVAEAFRQAFANGESFGTIVQARKRAEEVLGRKISEDERKLIEEAIEMGVALRARDILEEARASGREDAETFAAAAMVDLFKSQPRFGNQRTPSHVNRSENVSREEIVWTPENAEMGLGLVILKKDLKPLTPDDYLSAMAQRLKRMLEAADEEDRAELARMAERRDGLTLPMDRQMWEWALVLASDSEHLRLKVSYPKGKTLPKDLKPVEEMTPEDLKAMDREPGALMRWTEAVYG